MALRDVFLEIAMDLVRSTVGKAKVEYLDLNNVNIELGDLSLIGNGELWAS